MPAQAPRLTRHFILTDKGAIMIDTAFCVALIILGAGLLIIGLKM